MTSREFCYWLQGYFEISDADTLEERQLDVVKKHLAMVFIHEIDPSYPTKQQTALNTAHNGPPRPGRPGEGALRC
jgi:hypothetical protein